jgi:hypothetical protein
MGGTGDYRFANVGRNMAHDNGLQRAERFLSPDGEDRHSELYLLERLVIRCILSKC